MDRIPLTALARALADLTGCQVSYRQLYMRVLDGKIPATAAQNGRLSVARDELPAIAATLGLTRAKNVAA